MCMAVCYCFEHAKWQRNQPIVIGEFLVRWYFRQKLNAQTRLQNNLIVCSSWRMCVSILFFSVYWMNDRPTNQISFLKSTQIVFSSSSLLPLLHWNCDLCYSHACEWMTVYEGMSVRFFFILDFAVWLFLFAFAFISLFLFHVKFWLCAFVSFAQIYY